jgi:Cellulase (glycosyl hydrolase family 5)
MPAASSAGKLASGALAAALALACALAVLLSAGAGVARASKSQWSVFEDHPWLVQTDPVTRARTLDEIQALGADTIRIEVKWNEVAPSAYSKQRPNVDTSDPGVYPGFQRYDELVKLVTERGLRILMTLTGDAPRWATARDRGENYKPEAAEYAKFVTAVGKRYSGLFGGLPKIQYFTIWNEPNHIQFIKPTSQAPIVYRKLVDAALPALRAAAPGAKVFVGELKPTPRKGFGPLQFLQDWLCLDKNFKRLRGKAARKKKCSGFKKVVAAGFAHHPYGPVGLISERKDIVNLLAIKRLAKALDKAARAGRINRGLPIYNTEYGIQTNPPDIFVSTNPTRQAQIINEKEEFAYRYARLKSHSQYQLYDGPGRAGPPAIKWSGFQTGLRFSNGKTKPALNAYRFPIVVRKVSRGRQVVVWGRVRPGKGARFAQIERFAGGRWVKDGPRLGTNALGYFSKKKKPAAYRFQAYGKGPTGNVELLGTSRVAKPSS